MKLFLKIFSELFTAFKWINEVLLYEKPGLPLGMMFAMQIEMQFSPLKTHKCELGKLIQCTMGKGYIR